MNDEPAKHDPAAPFRKMAESIDRNPGLFGGSCVIQPPGGEQAIEILFVTATPEADTFWGTIQARVKIEMDRLDERQRGQLSGWPSR